MYSETTATEQVILHRSVYFRIYTPLHFLDYEALKLERNRKADFQFGSWRSYGHAVKTSMIPRFNGVIPVHSVVVHEKVRICTCQGFTGI
jgi:hypothetical protein